jgi:hypothetical protein
MQRRTAAAGAAVVLAASVTGLAATSGSAQATTHDAAAKAPSAQVMKLTSTRKGSFRISTTTIRPGNTLFKVYRGGKGGQAQVLRLRKGYSLQQAGKDFGALFTGNVKAVRRIDNNVVFYGGIDVPKAGVKAPNEWGVNLDKPGTYYVVNTGTNSNPAPTPFTVRGQVHRGALPTATGWVNPAGTVGANRWVTPATDPHKGWMKTTNKAQEPHFPVLNQVQESTTDQDVQDYINQNTQTPPSWALPGNAEANVISPGHTMVWKYSVPAGKYIVMCFWPSKTNGMPHFSMGMWKLFHLS